MKKAIVIVGLAVLTAPVGYNIATSYVGDEDLWRLARSREMSLKDALLQSNAHLPGWQHFRPGQYAVLFLTARLFGRAAWLYHLTFYSCHLLSALFLFLLTLQLTRNRACAFIASTLFLYNQANTEISCVLMSFHYIQLVFFSLLCMLFLARHLGRDRAPDLALSILCFVLALFSDTPSPLLMVFIVLLTECFYSKKMTIPRRLKVYAVYGVILLAFLLIRRTLVHAPMIGTAYLSSPSVIAMNCLAIVRAIFLPYDTMCLPPYETPFLALYFLLGYAYAVSFLLFILRERARNRLFLFSLLCFAIYVPSVGNFFGHERVCSLAVPFYALLIASLFYHEYASAGMPYKFATIALYTLLMANNYSLLLLRTHDWSVAGRINKRVMEIVARHAREIPGRRVHMVGLNEVRLWFLRGKPIVGAADELYRWCHWWRGGDRALDEALYREWSGYKEIVRAYKYGANVVADNDLVVALEKKRRDGGHDFTIVSGAAKDILADRLGPMRTPRESFPVRVNFQCFNTISVPMKGFEIDEGRGYEPWRGYGWNEATLGMDRTWDRWRVVDICRKSIADHMKDTFVYTPDGGGRWKIDLDNGRYYVSLGWCDTWCSIPPQRVAIEGRVVADAGRLRPGELYAVEDIPVTVRDGSLSMDLIPASPLHRAIINYLVIKKNVRARQAGD